MFAVMFYGGIVVALLIVLIEYRCAKFNKKFYKNSTSNLWDKVYTWRYLIAFILIPIMMLEYPISVDGANYRIFGLPLLGAVFDSNGRDFLSIFTSPFLVIDALIWYFSIHILLCVSQRWMKGKMDEK